MQADNLKKLCQLLNIPDSFIDASGNNTYITQESQKNLIESLGFDISSTDKITGHIKKLTIEKFSNYLACVNICSCQNNKYKLKIYLKKSDLKKPFTYLIKNLQNKKLASGNITPILGDIFAQEKIKNIEYVGVLVELDLDIEIGYYKISLFQETNHLVDADFFVAPKECFIPDNIKKGTKLWGISAQLYALRSNSNWGIGDFSDLLDLLKKTNEYGADFIGLNPIHALYPANPEAASPYSPSSRKWLNIIYIDVNKLLDFKNSKKAQKEFNLATTKKDLEQARTSKYIDYTLVSKLKLKFLRLSFEEFLKEKAKKNSARFKNFLTFCKEGEESLFYHAVFDAIQAKLTQESDVSQAWGWPIWQEEYQNINSKKVKGFIKNNKKEIDFFCYLQWVASEQFKEVYNFSLEKKMTLGLYKDLAVGVSQGGSETFLNKGSYALDLSIGAPPDILGPLGQNWGLPPINPMDLAKNSYQDFINLLRSNMDSCGALRIDHIMAFYRLWLVKNKKSAKDGAYINCDIDAFLAIVAIESQKRKCLIIGEDLGTVPMELQDKLLAKGIFSYKIFFFTRASDGGFIAPCHYKKQALSTLSTHDMPTIRGFWRCYDLELGKKLGIYNNEETLQDLYKQRHDAKQKILDSMHGLGSLKNNISKDVNQTDITKELNYAMHLHMADTSSSLFAIQLEDLLEMDEPVNVPGTSDEYPNWRRKLSKNIEDIFKEKDITILLEEITKIRKNNN